MTQAGVEELQHQKQPRGRETEGKHTMVIRARKQTTADSRVPRYLQVASVLRRRIRDGHWPVGAKIATLEETACG